MLSHNTQSFQLSVPVSFQRVPVRWKKLPTRHKTAAASSQTLLMEICQGMEACPSGVWKAHSTVWRLRRKPVWSWRLCQLWPLNLSSKWNQIIYSVCRFETSNTAEESSGPRLLKLPTVNSVQENNYLRVFPPVHLRSLFMIVKDVKIRCEKNLYKATAYIGLRIKQSPQTIHS